MSTQYSTVFGYGFVIDQTGLETVAEKFIDIDDDDEMDNFLSNAGDFLEPYVDQVGFGVKIEMSYNLEWNSDAAYLIGVNFVDDYDPWGGPLPLVTPATPDQREVLEALRMDLGLPKCYIGEIYGLCVG